MAVRLEQLRAFEAVARLGTFTLAADELFLTQPSLSRQIAALEAAVGAELFARGRRGVTLTVAGETLLPITRRIILDLARAQHELDELAGLRRGRVRLGAPPTLCVSLVAEVLAGFSPRYPGIELVITEAGNEALNEQLHQGQLDLALTVTRGTVGQPSGVELMPLLEEELVVVSARADLPNELTLEQLAGLPQVAFDHSYDLRRATDAAFAAHGLTPQIAVEGAQMDAVLGFVARGIGAAVVPVMVVANQPELTSARLVSPTLNRTVNLARRSEVRPSAAAARMHQLVIEVAGRTTTPGVHLAPALQ